MRKKKESKSFKYTDSLAAFIKSSLARLRRHGERESAMLQEKKHTHIRRQKVKNKHHFKIYPDDPPFTRMLFT